MDVSSYETLAVASDLAVVDAYRRNRSEAAARVLIDRFSARTLRTVARMLGEHADAAEDVLQDAWIKAFGAISQYRADSTFGTWLTRIAIRGALDHLRRHDVRVAHLALDDARAAPAIDRDVELSTDIEQALARLTAHPRCVIVMHDIEGYTHQDIADALGIAVGTSKVHLHNARRKLRAMLDPDSHTEATA
jgi:RNA polymerase sigma-70 factor (ECF subfamily)